MIIDRSSMAMGKEDYQGDVQEKEVRQSSYTDNILDSRTQGIQESPHTTSQ